MCQLMLCLNVKKINKTNLFVKRIISAAVDGVDSWSRLWLGSTIARSTC